MSFYEEHKQGIIGTVIYHVIILLLLIFLGFFTPLPLPGEEGILVNFGNSENGFGEREPSPRKNNAEPAQTQPQQQEEQQQSSTPPVTTPPRSIPEPEPAEEIAMTQDYEETAAIDAAEKKKREEEAENRRKQLEEERKRQEQIELERQRQAEQERIRQEEIERQRQAEAERKRQEEAERKRKEEEQRKISEINSRAEGTFSNSGSGTGGQGTSNDSKGQGRTFPDGNQGVTTGDPNAGNYGPGGSGAGNQGDGISYSLSGRSAKSLPKPRYPGNDEGTVVVKVTVDKYGSVTAAEPGVRGTTIANQQFWNEAKQAALKAKFNVDESAPAFQQGTISYKFVLD